ncbi:hypothetical protein [Nocardioides marmoriginsengisoli]|uniref:hypothetical protein n=1 Tax=Nocardioides marmoriginsengisoli TaxID=661483 RepID=UPI001610B1D0|nr:hypothetical protein [Nocardioides marmoriginsengisoli]
MSGRRSKAGSGVSSATMLRYLPALSPPARPRRRVLVSWTAALLVAAALAGSGGVAWWRAAHDERAETAGRRDAVVIAATRAIETMNTLDYRKVEDGLEAWSATTTGTLHDQLQQVGKEDQALLAQQKKVSTGKVVGLAVVDLGTTTATVVASVQVTVRDGVDAAAEPTVKRNRFTADLVRVGGTWKLESLQQVAVHL